MYIPLKIGRNVVNITENDIVVDNGTCIQVITRIIADYSEYPPQKHPLRMSKKLFKELKKYGFLYTDDILKNIAKSRYHSNNIVLYKFNIEEMAASGYDVIK